MRARAGKVLESPPALETGLTVPHRVRVRNDECDRHVGTGPFGIHAPFEMVGLRHRAGWHWAERTNHCGLWVFWELRILRMLRGDRMAGSAARRERRSLGGACKYMRSANASQKDMKMGDYGERGNPI